jgi:hypothetical protein
MHAVATAVPFASEATWLAPPEAFSSWARQTFRRLRQLSACNLAVYLETADPTPIAEALD